MTALETVEMINSGAESRIVLESASPLVLSPTDPWINEHALIAESDAANPAKETEIPPNTGAINLLPTVIFNGLKTAVWAKASTVGKVTAPTAAEPRTSLLAREEWSSVVSMIM